MQVTYGVRQDARDAETVGEQLYDLSLLVAGDEIPVWRGTVTHRACRLCNRVAAPSLARRGFGGAEHTQVAQAADVCREDQRAESSDLRGSVDGGGCCGGNGWQICGPEDE